MKINGQNQNTDMIENEQRCLFCETRQVYAIQNTPNGQELTSVLTS